MITSAAHSGYSWFIAAYLSAQNDAAREEFAQVLSYAPENRPGRPSLTVRGI